MKTWLLLSVMATLLLSNSDCGKKDVSKVYTGRLEVRGLCSNITISVVGNAGDLAVEQSWTDETTNKVYANAFALANPCAFPAGINTGEEFRFSIDTTKQADCAVCMAYYPKPAKALSIKVIPK